MLEIEHLGDTIEALSRGWSPYQCGSGACISDAPKLIFVILLSCIYFLVSFFWAEPKQCASRQHSASGAPRHIYAFALLSVGIGDCRAGAYHTFQCDKGLSRSQSGFESFSSHHPLAGVMGLGSLRPGASVPQLY
jgi:hypothetical protein